MLLSWVPSPGPYTCPGPGPSRRVWGTEQQVSDPGPSFPARGVSITAGHFVRSTLSHLTSFSLIPLFTPPGSAIGSHCLHTHTLSPGITDSPCPVSRLCPEAGLPREPRLLQAAASPHFTVSIITRALFLECSSLPLGGLGKGRALRVKARCCCPLHPHLHPWRGALLGAGMQ